MVRKVFSLAMPFDLLVIDDGSPDGTGAIVKQLQSEYSGKLHLIERQGKLGLGSAYIVGFKWCLEKEYDYICEMDCDFSHNPEDLLKLQKACSEDGADLSVGSRYVNHMVNVVNWPIGRVLLSYFASMYVRLITGMDVMDTTAGFVCYKREVLEKIELDRIRFKGYAFQIEMKFTAIKYGFNLKEIAIIFTDRTAGESKMSKGIVREAFLGVIQLKINSWFRKYK